MVVRAPLLHCNLWHTGYACLQWNTPAQRKPQVPLFPLPVPVFPRASPPWITDLPMTKPTACHHHVVPDTHAYAHGLYVSIQHSQCSLAQPSQAHCMALHPFAVEQTHDWRSSVCQCGSTHVHNVAYYRQT